MVSKSKPSSHCHNLRALVGYSMGLDNCCEVTPMKLIAFLCRIEVVRAPGKREPRFTADANAGISS